MAIHSIRWRLLTWIAFLLLCIVCGFGVSSYGLARSNRLGAIDDALRRRVAALTAEVRGGIGSGPPPGRNAMGRPGDPPSSARRPAFDGDRPPPPPDDPDHSFERPPPPPDGGPGGQSGADDTKRVIKLSPGTAGLFPESEPTGYYYAVWSRNGPLLKRSENAPKDLGRPEHRFAGGRVEAYNREQWREAHYFTELGDCMLAGISMTAFEREMRTHAWRLVLVGASILAVGLGGGWLVASRAIRPIEGISAAALRISAGNLSERISVSDTDSELGRLAALLNATFARLEASFAEQKQFTADASHELRTPLTVIMTEAQSTLTRDRSPEEYRETLETCLEAAQQMRRLADSLLELARFDAGQAGLRRSSLDLAEIARSCVELVQPLAEQRQLTTHCVFDAATTTGDPDRIRQVVTNLLANSIYYNREGGEIRVATRKEKSGVILTVADTGCGISAEDLPNIFKRFYRADKARTNPDGRSGLGLAIVKAIVDLHGGKIDVQSRLGTGTTVTVTLPAE